MNRTDPSPVGINWILGLAIALAFALICASVASAQTSSSAGTESLDSADDAYGTPQSDGGAMEDMNCSYIESDDGVLNAGDVVVYPGGFEVVQGASVTLDDADGTVGTLVDGENAQISADADSLTVAVTGDPINVSGGDGVMNDTVCNSIVASTGISGGDASSSEDAAAEGVLPDTGGPVLSIYLGLLLISVGGLALLRYRKLHG